MKKKENKWIFKGYYKWWLMTSHHCSGPWKKKGGASAEERLSPGCLLYNNNNVFSFCWGMESEGSACPVRRISIALEECASVRNWSEANPAQGRLCWPHALKLQQAILCNMLSILRNMLSFGFTSKKLCYWAYCQLYDECPTCFFPATTMLLEILMEFLIDRRCYTL